MRSIAIRIEDDLFREIHIRAAEKELSIQDYVRGLMERDLHPAPKLNDEQMERLKIAMTTVDEKMRDVAEILEEARNQNMEASSTSELQIGAMGGMMP